MAGSFQSMAKKKKREIKKKKKKKREIKKKRKREIKKKSFAELPEPIIQHILSFLPEKDAIKASILSKAWLSAWRTKPNLEFDSELFFEMESKIRNMGSDDKEKVCKKFSKYIKRTLERYNQQKIRIETLKLDFSVGGGTFSYSQLERCTLVAVERGVRNLDLSESFRELPRFVLGAKSLEDLRLLQFKMLHLSTEKIMWHSLKRLWLVKVCVDEVLFENIISNCPLLQDLEICCCTDDVLQFKVMEHHNLKELDVSLLTCQGLILGEAPKLESLICTSHHTYILHYGYFEYFDWKPLEDCDRRPCVSLHSSQYQNLKMLDLCAVGISDNFFNNFEHKFPHLQDLLLQYCRSLRRIEILSPSLERIHFVENCELEEAHFDVPNIELFECVCYNCKIIPEFSFSTATKCHWISNLWIRWRDNVETPWFLQLKKFLVNLIPSRVFLHIEIDGRIEFDTNEIRGSRTFGEPPELQELCLVIDSSSIHSSSILSVLDGFFSICRPNSLSQLCRSRSRSRSRSRLWLGNCSHKDDLGNCSHKDDLVVMKLFYDIIMFRTNHDHQQIKCWHHDLRQAKVQIYRYGRQRIGNTSVYLKKDHQQIKCWHHDLRQAKVQIYCYGRHKIGNSYVYLKKELVHKQPEALDWESILEKLRTPLRERIIHFALNWEKNSMSKN